jgi:hypothetical protein
MVIPEHYWVTNMLISKLLLPRAFWPVTCMLTLENALYNAAVVHTWFSHHFTSILHNYGIIYTTQNVKPKLQLQNGAATKLSYPKCRKALKLGNVKLKTIIYYLCGVMVRTMKNEPKMPGCLQLRHLKLGLYCIYNTGQTKICGLITYNLYHVLISKC